jgi:hypothetical protein
MVIEGINIIDLQVAESYLAGKVKYLCFHGVVATMKFGD